MRNRKVPGAANITLMTYPYLISARARTALGIVSLAFLAFATAPACSSKNEPNQTSSGGISGLAGGAGVGGSVAEAGSGGALTGGADATGEGGAAGSGGAAEPGAAGSGGSGLSEGGSGGTAGASQGGAGGAPPVAINVLAIGELTVDGQPEIHAPFVEAAKDWLDTQDNLTVTHIESPDSVTDTLLADYSLILQLNFTPYRWSATAKAAFETYITEGNGGWVGLHHAGLYGLGNDPWPWFFDFFGQITYQNYIATFAAATVRIEDTAHPLFAGVPENFTVTTDEWYVWNMSPRANVQVLANVDEDSYDPPSNITMGGDHPVIWSNDDYPAKNVYIFIGHHPNLFQNPAYVTLLRNAINWAGSP